MSRSRVVLAVWLAGLLVAVAILAVRGRVHGDLSAFLPHDGDPAMELLLGQLQRGPASNLLLIGIRGGKPERAAAVSNALVGDMQDSGRFRTVTNGGGHLQPDPWVRRYRYLLSDRVEPGYFSEQNLGQAFRDLVERLQDPGARVDTRTAAADPTGEYAYLLRQWTRDGPPRRQGVWMTPDGTALLLATTAARGGDLDAMEQALATVRDAFAQRRHDKALKLVLSGAPAIAVATRDIVRGEAGRLTAWAGGTLLLLLLVVLRSVRSVLVAAVPVASGLVAAAATVVAVFGGIHGITLAFGSTLLGIGVDYPLHLLGHVRDGDAGLAARRIRRPLFVGAATTALGFAALMLAGFSGLVQLGIFAVVGVATAATVTYTVLPVILGRRPVRRPRMPAAPPVPRRLGRWMPLLALALGAAGTVVGWQGSVLETDLGGLTPVPRELRTTDARFRQSLGVGDARHVVLVPGDSREQALARTQAVCDRLESLADAGRIGGFDCASTYLPPPSVQRRRQEALPDRQELNRRIAGAVRGLPLRAAALTPFVDDVTRSRALKPLRAADLGAGPIAEKIRGMLQAQGSRWYSLVRLSAVDADTLDALDGAAASVPGGRLVDLRRTAEKAIAGYQRAAVWHCLEGAVLILVLLAVVLRDPLRLVRVAAAAFGAVGIALAVVTMSAGTVTLFHLVSLLLTAGLGLDYALFTTQPRQHGAGARSVSICAVSTLIAFGILATSTVPVLEQIGATVFVGATAAWVLAVLVAAAEGDDGEREAEVP